jgi:4'-phosphopantetheinyl transferase
VLNRHTIHIWHTTLKCHAEKHKLFRSWLSSEEKARAARLAAPYQLRFITSRGLLRDLLAYYCKQSPKQLDLSYTSSGKPLLISPSTKQQIEFNLSHSKNIIVFAFAINTPIGIDIEHKIPRKHLENIAYRFFSAYDYERLKLLSGEKKLTAFFNTWVRNEALLKAFGYRLQTHPFSQYQFSIGKQLIASKPIKPPHCQVSTLSIHPDFAGAIAIKGKNKLIITKEYIEKMSLR